MRLLPIFYIMGFLTEVNPYLEYYPSIRFER